VTAVIDAAQAAALARPLKGGIRELMVSLLPCAATYAISPIADYPVGAVALGTSGSLYLGANMEYVGTALSFTLHAEQSATINAWQNDEQGLDAIAVSSAPCGSCRQFLYELTTAEALVVHIRRKRSTRLTTLLPKPFGPADLEVAATLMSSQNHGLTLVVPSSDALVLEALAAANASYAPHTGDYAGVALETASGAVYRGRYAENAAFNPGVSPLEAALTMRVLDGRAADAVTRAVLVETASKASQEGATGELLRVVAGIQPEVHQAA
jgi:cytidine deaminase